ncbi:MAG TPA: carboxypeptidase regulatory-like domain-containing protein [Acidobacteriaceae bacterium]|jgi:hypothetical protein|nr:carboxypeptidase regulatory-like domain-containing protein [Acidobacteriaceae bacterium]
MSKYREFRKLWLGSCGLVLLLAAVFATLLTPRVSAQTDTGTIVGTVTDTTGAVISGATATAINNDNGLTLHAVASPSGEFTIPALPRGNYTVTVDAKGFETEKVAVTVNVTSQQTLIIQLKPGASTTTVEVSGAAPLVNTTTPTMGETISGQQVTELPLNGRNFTNLALLAPGVTRGAYGDAASGVSGNTETLRYNESGGAALSINGLRPQSNNYILDGVDNNDGLVNTILFFPPIDATQEFKIDTSVAPAEFGRAGGAIVVSSIKSGTNEIHGSAFEFYRSGKFDSNPDYQFLGAPQSPNPAYNRNQWGGSAGLPIIKNHLFLFGDYQAYREVVPTSPNYVTVPTTLMRQGNFTELENPALATGLASTGYYKTNYPLCAGANAGKTSPGLIYDPTTCTPFANNTIPTARLNPAAVNYLNAFPAPSRTDRIFQNYLVHQSGFNNYNTFDTRLDWDPTAKDQAFFRFSYDNTVNVKTSEFANLPAGYGSGSNPTHARGYDLGYTHIFSPYIVNEAHLAYNRDMYGYQPPMYGDAVSSKLGIVNANINQETSGGALIGGWAGDLEYTGDYGLYAVPQNTYEINDAVTWDHGKHSFKYGATLIRRQVEYFNPQEGKGYFWIDSGTVDFTGYEVSELLAGGVDTYQIGSQSGFFANVGQEDGFFAQDDWRVSPRLTLNLGLRWDYLSRPYEAHNQQSAFDVNNGTVLLAGQNGVSRSIVNQDYHAFGPRFGFAYDVSGTGKTVVRGGYGIFYFLDYGGVDNQLGENPPYGGSYEYLASNGYCITFTGQTSTQTGSYNCSGYTSPAAVKTALPARGFPNFNPAKPAAGLSMTAVDQSNQDSMVQEWNLQVEHQLGRNNVVDIAYVGTRGEHLSSYYPYNMYQFGTGKQNFPSLGGINYNVYNGDSNYNGLQIHAEHRSPKGLTMTGSYAWSHTLDDSPGAFQTQTAALWYDPQASYGNSAQDQRQIFSSSAIYFLPFGRGQKFGGNVSRPVDWAIGGWQFNLIALLQTGTPVDLSTGQDNPGNRPDLVSSISYPKSISGYWFNPASFSSNIPTVTASNGTVVYTRLGSLGRDQVFGPGTRTVDFSTQKDLHLTEKYTLELHGDAFNVLNTPQFANPNAGMNSPSTFGKVTSVRNFTNRQIQLAARFVF